MDFNEEGTFAWIGPKKLVQGIVFWVGGLGGVAWEDAYANWADDEPNEVKNEVKCADLAFARILFFV